MNAGALALIVCAKTRSNRSFTTMRHLLEGGCNCNMQDTDGRSALHYACQRGVAVNLLLEAGADPNIRDNDGNVPVLVASTEGFDQVVCSLLEHGCDPDICNNSGRAAIHLLAMKNHYRAIEAIVDAGGDVNIVDGQGAMPLWYAVNHNRHHAVKSLLRANCYVDPPKAAPGDGGEQVENRVPLKTALCNGLFGIAKLLVLAGCQLSALYEWLDTYEQNTQRRERERADRIRLWVDSDEESDSSVEDEMMEHEAYQWFQDWAHSPHTLRQLSRISIRRYVGKHILRKADDLPLPKPIIDYVTLREVEDHALHGRLM